MLGWAVTSGVLVILVLFMRLLFKGKISLRLQYGLWLLVLVRLLVPVNLFDTDISVLNVLYVQAEADTLHVGLESGAVDLELQPGVISQQDGGQKNDVTHASYAGYVNHKELSVPETEELASHGGEAVQRAAWLSKLPWLVWITGMIAVAAVLLGINIHFSRRLRRARKLMRDRGVVSRRKSLPVYVVQGISSPCLFGLIHPAIYLPEGVSEEQLPYVLAHEVSHYCAGDHIWSLLRSLCLALHWYHPLVWLAVYVSRQDSELACDERTIRRLGEDRRNTYGRILVDLTVEKVSAADFLCCATTMTADGRSLKERVRLIAHKPHMLAATGGIVAVLTVVVFCVACTGAREVVDSELDKVEDSALDIGENETLETSGDRKEENGPETAKESEENAYYRVVKSASIDDPYFTMKVPESFVGQVAYGVVLGESAAGEKYLQNLTFFHIDSMNTDAPQDVPKRTWQEIYYSGTLGSYDWTGYLDMEELEEIAYRSGTWDIRGMQFILVNDYDWYAGISGRLAQANRAGTGAYFYMEPTDVQFDLENPDGYMACFEDLAVCWDHFAAKGFPYEELEGYPGDNYSETPQWRQDFETAEMVYSWFTCHGQVPIRALTGSDMGSRPYEAPDGLLYGVVDVPGVSSMEELSSYLSRYFAPEIVEGLMSGHRPTISTKGGKAPFMELEGQLYALDGWVTEHNYIPSERQYDVHFSEYTENGQWRSIQAHAENGGRRRADIYMHCLYYIDAPEPIRETLHYIMEEQEDGSWRIVDDFELAVSLMLYANVPDSPYADRIEAFRVQ